MLDPKNLTNKGEQNEDMESRGKGELEGYKGTESKRKREANILN